MKTSGTYSLVFSIGVFLVIFLFMGSARADLLNTLSDGSTSKNLTFTGNQNQTVYLAIPKISNVSNAQLNISDYYTRKEHIGQWTTVFHGIARLDAQNLSYIFSSTDGFTFDSIKLHVKNFTGSNPTKNTTIKICQANTYNNFSCNGDYTLLKTFNQTILDAPTNYNVNGWNYTITLDTSYIILPNVNYSLVFNNSGGTGEMDMFDDDSGATCPLGNNFMGLNGAIFCLKYSWWLNGTNASFNPYLDVSSDGDAQWSFLGEFNQINNRTSDFSSEINSYLLTCTADAFDSCNVPLVFHSDTTGTLQISDINMTYSLYPLQIVVRDENTLNTLSWWKVFVTNGSSNRYYSVGRGTAPSAPLLFFLGDSALSYEQAVNYNYTYNMGYNDANFSMTTGGTNDCAGCKIGVSAWNMVQGKWDIVGNATCTLDNINVTYFSVNNINGTYGDLSSQCQGYYCPLFNVQYIAGCSGAIRLYNIKLVTPYSYDINGVVNIIPSVFADGFGSGRFVFDSSVVASSSNNYGLRTYFTPPASLLNAYLNGMCYGQEFQVVENSMTTSGFPTVIPNALVTIERNSTGDYKVIDQQLTDGAGLARVCVQAGYPYAIVSTASGYNPLVLFNDVFSNAGSLYLRMVPIGGMTFFNPYTANITITPNNYYIIHNATETRWFSCLAAPPKNSTTGFFTVATYEYLVINYTNITTGFPPVISNYTGYPPVYNASQLPFYLNLNFTVDWVTINSTIVTGYPFGYNFTFNVTDDGLYKFSCGMAYIIINDTSPQNLTGTVWYPSIDQYTWILSYKGVSGAGRYLPQVVSEGGIYLVALVLDMFISSFFVKTFGVTSAFIFILIWGIMLTIFGGWGFNVQSGVFFTSILLWMTLMVFPYRRG